MNAFKTRRHIDWKGRWVGLGAKFTQNLAEQLRLLNSEGKFWKLYACDVETLFFFKKKYFSAGIIVESWNLLVQRSNVNNAVVIISLNRNSFMFLEMLNAVLRETNSIVFRWAASSEMYLSCRDEKRLLEVFKTIQ